MTERLALDMDDGVTPVAEGSRPNFSRLDTAL